VTRVRAVLSAILVALAIPGCGGEPEAFPEPGDANESSAIIRETGGGDIIVVYSPYPLRRGAPPDGVRRAAQQAIGRGQCSAAAFFWSEKAMSIRWIRSQIAERIRFGLPPRVILAGHGLGATAAAETARTLCRDPSDVVVALLLTVDAVKTGPIGSAAGVTGSVIASSLPGVKVSFAAYDSAPAPDGLRLLAHVNYYQTATVYHGAPMPGAENHRLDDSTGVLNHGNVDDFAFPMLASDLRRAMAGGGS
jgi:pimeloyl-ACP methyl ester carboxylesterase